MPDSDVNYPRASSSTAFIATEPYVINIQGVPTTIPLWGASRSNDFSGNMPFVNKQTARTDPAQIQAWDPVFAASFTPFLSGSFNLNDDQIGNTGFPGRVDKRIINGTTVTMVRYNAGDGTTEGKCRSQLNAYPIPPRTHVRWELEVAFGNVDGVNDWVLTPTGTSPVLFWQMHSMNQSNPPLQADVDTDSNDPSKLMINFLQRVSTATKPVEIGSVHGINRNTMIPIVIEAFLDERANADGGKGLLQIWVNQTLLLEKAGPTLALGPNPHWWAINMYLWNEPSPYYATRASFWKTAKMMVFPTGASDSTPPSSPMNLTATVPDTTKANLLWNASTDNVGVTGYKVYRNGIEIGTTLTPAYTDKTVNAGSSYVYAVRAYDAANNLSATSNTVTINVPLQTNVSITSNYVGNVTANSAVINWATNVSSIGSVYYGTSSNNLIYQASANNAATKQSVKITGLTNRTLYYFKIIASNGLSSASSSISSFKTTRR